MIESHEVFELRHFTIEKIADGVFAVFHRAGGWAISNSGIVDLGEFSHPTRGSVGPICIN